MVSGGLLGAGREARQAERRAHHLQESAALRRIQPIRSAVGKFVFEKLLEFVGVGELFQAPPILRSFAFVQ